MEVEAWSRQETSSGSTEWHILVAMKMQHSNLLLWEIAISSCCPSGPSTTLMPRPCLPPAIPSVLKRAHLVRCRTPPRITLSQGLPYRLESFLKLHRSLILFLPSVFHRWYHYCGLKALLAFLALSSKKYLAHLTLIWCLFLGKEHT